MPSCIGRFQIEETAGSGAMGTIYRATDPESGARVALKLIRSVSPADITRFTREGRLLAALQHPAIVRYVEHGTTPDGDAYLAMEWLDGEDLRVRLSRDGLDLGETVILARRVAAALAVLHAHHLVHRDIKPGNLFLVGGRVEDVKLIDFGLARRHDYSTELTRTGIVVGTPTFMAPEQARGQRDIDARADIFSLGCVLYRCITGRRPFEGNNVMAVLTKVVLDEHPPLRELRPDVPAALEAVIERMLAKDPADRYASGAELCAALDALPAAPVDSLRSGPRSGVRAAGLSESEYRIAAMVLLGPAPSADDTLVNGEETPLVKLAEVAREHRGSLDTLPDGTRVVRLPGSSVPTDQAAQAARCALALRALLPGMPLGIAMVRSGASISDVLARSAKHAPPSIALDEAVEALLDARFTVHGGDLMGFDQRKGGARSVLGKVTPLLGREWEMSTVRTFFRECVEDSSARAVLITGAAGMGKSRLAQELTAAIRAAHPEVQVWSARADALRTGSPFGLLRNALHAANKPFPHDERLSLQAARADPRGVGEEMSRAFVELVAAECAARPLLLVLEDLHWADAPSVRFVAEALASLERAPFMVLAFARPEVHAVFPKLWADRSVQELRLKPLSRRAAERLVREVLGEEAGESTVARLVARADGNAFYLEELIRDAAQRRSRHDESDTLPETVLAMAQARLEALAPELRRVLRAASVFGEVFWPGAVEALLGGGAPSESWTSQLTAWEVAARRPESRFDGEPELCFRHALLREAAYAMLPPEERALAHHTAGEWLEQHGERDPLVLAHHFSLGGDDERAASLLARAAERALFGVDLVAAVSLAERALASAGSAADRLRSAAVLAEAYVWRYEWLAARPHIDTVLRTAEPGSAPWIRAMGWKRTSAHALLLPAEAMEAHAALMGVDPLPDAVGVMTQALSFGVLSLVIAARLDAARAALAKLDRHAAPVADEDALVRGYMLLAHANTSLWAEGDLWAGREQAEAALAAFVEARHASGVGLARTVLATTLLALGAHTAAEREVDAIQGKDSLASTIGESTRIWALIRRGALEEAAARLDRLLADPLLRDISTTEPRVLWAKGEIARLGGDPRAAEEAIAAALPGMQKLAYERPVALAMLAQARLALGRAPEALEAARDGLDALNALGGHGLRPTLVRLSYAEALHATGAITEARTVLADARDHLHALAERITDEDARRTFLTEIDEHARTIALAEAWSSGVCQGQTVA